MDDWPRPKASSLQDGNSSANKGVDGPSHTNERPSNSDRNGNRDYPSRRNAGRQKHSAGLWLTREEHDIVREALMLYGAEIWGIAFHSEMYRKDICGMKRCTQDSMHLPDCVRDHDPGDWRIYDGRIKQYKEKEENKRARDMHRASKKLDEKYKGWISTIRIENQNLCVFIKLKETRSQITTFVFM